MKMINVVLVKHPNCGGQFMFRVPEDVQLVTGDRVLCNTKRGPCEMGTCITDSFQIADFHLEQLWNTKEEKLKPVVGKLKPVMFIYQEEKDGSD